MLELRNQLTDLDNDIIRNYVTTYGCEEEDYVGNWAYLTNWAASKKKLFRFLGGNLIYKEPISFEKDLSVIEAEISNQIWNHDGIIHRFYDAFVLEIRDLNLERDYTVIEPTNIVKIKTNLRYTADSDQLASNSLDDEYMVPTIITKEVDGKKKKLQITKSMKAMKAIKKIIDFFDLKKSAELYEGFRNAISVILNDKVVKGNLCFSIHPMDFLTSSDNDNNWSSCMSWRKQGCYRAGTVEMMNSNNVICVYLESNKDNSFYFDKEIKDDQHRWNSKKWRIYGYVTRDIVMAGKAYPFSSKSLAQKSVEIMKDLAKKNLNWTYEFGPELYKDMFGVCGTDDMERNKYWIEIRDTRKKNIIFDTNMMYNDMLNVNYRNFWCYRNKVKRKKVISVSGKANCVCCNGSMLEENEDSYYEPCDDDHYNNRFLHTQSVMCGPCAYDKYACSYCDEITFKKPYKMNNTFICENCLDEAIKKCGLCGKFFRRDSHTYTGVVAEFKEGRFSHNNPELAYDISAFSDHTLTGKYDFELQTPNKFALLQFCPECSKQFPVRHFEYITREKWEWEDIDNNKIRFIPDKLFDENDDFIKNNLFGAEYTFSEEDIEFLAKDEKFYDHYMEWQNAKKLYYD